jgi:Glycosyl transferase family group 2
MLWAANARGIILLVDLDTVVLEDCLRDTAWELVESPEVAIIQHESGGSRSCVIG